MKNASADPNKPVELNWVKGRTSHELNSCKLVEFSSAHVKYNPGLSMCECPAGVILTIKKLK